MITPWLTESLACVAGSPLLLFTTVFLLTFVLEDAVAVAAGLLAGRMLIDPAVTLAALVLGTVAGDLALHGAGRWLANTRVVGRLRTPAVRGVEEQLRKHGLLAVGIARFVPGTRLPVYLSSGLLHLPTIPTAVVVAVTTLLWTPGLFLLSLGAGEHVLAMLNPLSILSALLLVATIAAAPRLITRLRPVAT